MLRWILHQDPSGPINLQAARANPLVVVASGHVVTLQRIWPVAASLQEIYETACQPGELGMLRWVCTEQPAEAPGEQAAYLATTNDHLDVVEFLLACNPPVSLPLRLVDVH